MNQVSEEEEIRAALADMEARLTAEIVGAIEQAVCEERDAVVAWLRAQGMAPYAQSNLDYAAQMIERGEHRREREPLEDDSLEFRDIGKED
jgi:hypothetical protein